MDDELIDAIDKHGFVFWVCPNKCKGIVKWNESKTEAVCMECGTKSIKTLSKERHALFKRKRNDRFQE